jgi:tRNA threonylcarbamoyladenosine biosynthesis protein TsaE
MFREVQRQATFKVGLSDLPEVAKQALSVATSRVWLLQGEMGAGKTTFVKALCRELGVTDIMSSPTFSIVNEYQTAEKEKVFHFDFFRVKNENEAYEIGAEEYFYSGSYCFIEWPEKIPGLIPAVHVNVQINLESESLRTIEVSVHDGKEKNGI